MKQGTTRKTPAASPTTIDEYIRGFPSDVRPVLEEVRAVIKKAAPDAEEAIKYGIPTFVLGENLVHFGGFEAHVGFYPAPSGIEAFKDELRAYKSAKGSVQFPLGEPMPWKLIEKIVAFRVSEARSRAAAKKKKK